MEFARLGMINATTLADPNVFSNFFGISVEDFLKTTDPLPAEVIPYLWDEMPTEDDDFLWQAIKVPIADYQTAIAPLPRAVELHHVAQKLLGTSGHVVSFPPVIIPYCGGFARFGEFQMEPTSALIQKRRRRSTPFEQLREALSEERYQDCELMHGFAMCPHGHWMPHAWLTRADGTVFETGGHNSHFFGVKVPRDSINAIFDNEGGCD